MVNTLQKLYDSGELQTLIQCRLVSDRVMFWMDIYNGYQLSLSRTGCVMQAMEDTATDFGICVSTVQNIRRKFQEQPVPDQPSEAI